DYEDGKTGYNRRSGYVKKYRHARTPTPEACVVIFLIDKYGKAAKSVRKDHRCASRCHGYEEDLSEFGACAPTPVQSVSNICVDDGKNLSKFRDIGNG
ncbi:hypothetical protein TNIN_430861, partial [Trichonephila inaurata madagascariensis]